MARAKPIQVLYRGDDAKSVALPDPKSTRELVSHILFLGGAGRSTPWTSTTESKTTGTHFAGSRGRVWQTDVPTAQQNGARHVSQKDLLHLLKGYGKGKAKWPNAIEVAQARAYVLRWSEHLLDWKGHSAVGAAISATFK